MAYGARSRNSEIERRLIELAILIDPGIANEVTKLAHEVGQLNSEFADAPKQRIWVEPRKLTGKCPIVDRDGTIGDIMLGEAGTMPAIVAIIPAKGLKV